MAFANIVKEWNLKIEDIVEASRRAETRSAEDRILTAKRRQAAREGKKLVEAGIKKPKVGRGLTVKAVQIAIDGVPQSRIVRGKLLRAVNALAKHNKKKAVTTAELFGETKRRVGPKPVGKK